MIEKTRTFAATAVRETALKPPRNGVEAKVEQAVMIPAVLDPRADGKDLPTEFGGYKGPEPTRFGDWEHKGRCTDF
jgi:hypothetical protein